VIADVKTVQNVIVNRIANVIADVLMAKNANAKKQESLKYSEKNKLSATAKINPLYLKGKLI